MSEQIVVTEVVTLTSESLQHVAGGWGWKEFGEYVAPLVTAVTGGAGAPLANKGAAAQGAVGAAVGAASGMGNPLLSAVNAGLGFLGGYYSALIGRDFPV